MLRCFKSFLFFIARILLKLALFLSSFVPLGNPLIELPFLDVLGVYNPGVDGTPEFFGENLNPVSFFKGNFFELGKLIWFDNIEFPNTIVGKTYL